MIFDTHAHYTDEQYNDDRIQLLSSMPQNNVGLIMNVCSNTDEIPSIIELTKQFPFIYGAVGVHPECADTVPEDYLYILEQYAANTKIKAIGEIGLDYHWTTETKAKQQKIFAQQIELAKKLHLPVIVHDREAHADTISILKEHKVWECGGVFHCYSGSAEMVKEITDNLNMYIAFGGTVTFKNANKPKEAAKVVPLDRLLIETDSPYLTPSPHRGERNSSMELKYVVRMLSELKGMSEEEIEHITMENGKKLFSI